MEQYTTNTYRHGNVEIVVYRPVLDDKERQKREEAVKRALVCVGKDMLRRQK